MPSIVAPKLKKKYVTITPKSEEEDLLSLDELTIRQQYKAHGAILFRGFELNFGIFRSFTDRFCNGSAFNDSRGREVVDKENNIQTVNLGHVAFPLHPELARVPWKPDVCFFSCVTPPLNGGETTICDGTQIVQKLPSKMVKKLKTRQLLYRDLVSPQALKFWFGTDNPTEKELSNPPTNCPFIFQTMGSQVISYFKTPFLHKTMFNSRLAFGSFLLFARWNGELNFCTYDNGAPVDDKTYETIKKISDKLTIGIKWQKNDVLMLDNTRFMHGRNKILDVKHRLILSYFGYLKFAKPSAGEPGDVPWRTNECNDFFYSMSQS